MALRGAYLGERFVITSRLNLDGQKVWGFYVPARGRGQSPNWFRRKDAIESARFHIALWQSR